MSKVAGFKCIISERIDTSVTSLSAASQPGISITYRLQFRPYTDQICNHPHNDCVMVGLDTSVCCFVFRTMGFQIIKKFLRRFCTIVYSRLNTQCLIKVPIKVWVSSNADLTLYLLDPSTLTTYAFSSISKAFFSRYVLTRIPTLETFLVIALDIRVFLSFQTAIRPSCQSGIDPGRPEGTFWSTRWVEPFIRSWEKTTSFSYRSYKIWEVLKPRAWRFWSAFSAESKERYFWFSNFGSQQHFCCDHSVVLVSVYEHLFSNNRETHLSGKPHHPESLEVPKRTNSRLLNCLEGIHGVTLMTIIAT